MSSRILIADAGGTSSQWVMLSEEGRSDFNGEGFNPYVSDASVLQKIIHEQVKPKFSDVDQLYYYGAGCAREELRQQVVSLLEECFAGTSVYVQGDLYGAGRALLGDASGMAMILGTGTNAGYFESGQLKRASPSVGYLLGDEGSGFDIGKRFISAWYWNKLPAELQETFSDHVKMSKDEFLRKVYADPKPNTMVASYATFIRQQCHHEAVQDPCVPHVHYPQLRRRRTWSPTDHASEP